MTEGRLETARRLAAASRWPELGSLPCPLPLDGGEGPELAYLIADARRRTGNAADAFELAQAAAVAADRRGDARLRLRSINLLGMLEYEVGELDAAEHQFERLLHLASESHDDEFIARSCNNLGVLASVRGQQELALTAYQRAVAAYQRLQHIRGLAQTHYNLGIVYRDLGFPHEAERNFGLALRHAVDSESPDIVALADTERALLCIAAGDDKLGEKLAERALGKMRELGDPLGAANAIRVIAAAASARGDQSSALDGLESALATVGAHPDLLLLAEIQRDRGRILTGLGKTEDAAKALQEAVESFSRIGARREAAETAALLDRLDTDA